MKEDGWICICGERCPVGTLYCSPRCEFIANKQDTPMGAKMSTERAVRFFGKMYDKQQEAVSHPDAEKRK